MAPQVVLAEVVVPPPSEVLSVVTPSLPISLDLVSPVCVRVPGSDVVLPVNVSFVSNDTFPGFAAPPGLGMSSSPGSSLPRGERGVQSPAPVSGGAGACAAVSRSLRPSVAGGWE